MCLTSHVTTPDLGTFLKQNIKDVCTHFTNKIKSWLHGDKEESGTTKIFDNGELVIEHSRTSGQWNIKKPLK